MIPIAHLAVFVLADADKSNIVDIISKTANFDCSGLSGGSMVVLCMILGIFFKEARQYTTPFCVLALVYCVLKVGFGIDLLESLTLLCS